MSKTFESIDHTRQLHVKPLDNHVTLVINYKDAGRSGLTISHSDAPALALAILEAAGLTVAKDDFKEGSCEDVMIDASLHLKSAIRLQERATAEAEAQAKLEAEALELRKAWKLGDGVQVQKFEDLIEVAQEKWLAVARRAREINKEAPNGR